VNTPNTFIHNALSVMKELGPTSTPYAQPVVPILPGRPLARSNDEHHNVLAGSRNDRYGIVWPLATYTTGGKEIHAA
jgi:hypothetical protein